MKHFTLLILIAASLSSCFKKEDAIALPVGDSEIASVFLGTNYSKEVFFDLSTNSYQDRQLADWDIRFDASREGFGIYVNNGTNVLVRKLERYNFTEKMTYDSVSFLKTPTMIDAPEGTMETSAIGNWKQYKNFTLNGIYMIEVNYLPGIQRFKRLQVVNCDDTSYICRILDIFDKDGDTILNGPLIVIPKDPNQNFTYYSFRNGGHIVDNAEPNKNSWDFVFTRYKHIFYNVLPNNQPFPYTLTGVLSSLNNVEIARDSALTLFDNIDAGSLSKYKFTKNRNGIGYDWKTHAQGPVGAYSVAANLTYIIKDTDGYYYKLRFLDYNNALGQPGYPKFEFIRIK
ncbi:MAG: hypothetical protein JWP32_3002 [Schumannella sp.]|nr:hypothetical protein [Schumannella sp.]